MACQVPCQLVGGYLVSWLRGRQNLLQQPKAVSRCLFSVRVALIGSARARFVQKAGMLCGTTPEVCRLSAADSPFEFQISPISDPRRLHISAFFKKKANKRPLRQASFFFTPASPASLFFSRPWALPRAISAGLRPPGPPGLRASDPTRTV